MQNFSFPPLCATLFSSPEPLDEQSHIKLNENECEGEIKREIVCVCVCETLGVVCIDKLCEIGK